MYLCKLRNYRIRGSLFDWFQDYLHNRCQFVTYCNTSSQHISKYGLPQGSILGGLLFLIDIDDLIVHFSVPFAGDRNMFHNSKDINGSIANIIIDLEKVCDWLYANKLSIIVTKAHFIVWSPRITLLEDPSPII